MNGEYFVTDLFKVYQLANRLQIPVKFISFHSGEVSSFIDYLRTKQINLLPEWINEITKIFPLLDNDDIYYFIYLCYRQSLNNQPVIEISISENALISMLRQLRKSSEALFRSGYDSWVENFFNATKKEEEIFQSKLKIISTLEQCRSQPLIAVSEFNRASYRVMYSGIYNRLSSDRYRAGVADYDNNSEQLDSVKDLLLRYPHSEEIDVDNGIDIFADAVCTNTLPMIRYIDHTGEIKTKVYFSDDQYQKVLYSLVAAKIESGARNVIYFTIFSLRDLDWNKADKDSFQIGTIYLETNTVEILSRAEGKIRKKSKKQYISSEEILQRILHSFPSIHFRKSSISKIAGQFHMMINHRTNLAVFKCAKCGNETIYSFQQCQQCGHTEQIVTPYIEFTNLGIGVEMNSFLTFILTNDVGKYFIFAEESSSSTTEKLRKTLNYRKLFGQEYENLATGANESYDNKASTNVSFNIVNELGKNVTNKRVILSDTEFNLDDNNTLITIDITNAMSESSLKEFYYFFPYIVQVWYHLYLKYQYESFYMMPETLEYINLKREYERMSKPVAPPIHKASAASKPTFLSYDDLPEDANDVLRYVEFDEDGNIVAMPVYQSSNANLIQLANKANEASFEVRRVHPDDDYPYNIPGVENYIEFPPLSGEYYLADENHLVFITIGKINAPHVTNKALRNNSGVLQLSNADDSIEKYLNIYRGGIIDAKDKFEISKSDAAVQSPGQLARLPIGISSLLRDYSSNLYRMRYIATNSPNSFIDCICGAINDPYYAGTLPVNVPPKCQHLFGRLHGVKITSSVLRIIYVKLLRYRMATEVNLEVLRQEFPNINLKVIRKKLLKLDKYFPANMFYRLAEEFFNINIFLFSYVPILAVPTISKVKEAKSTVDDGLMCIPDHTSIAVRTFRPYRHTIGILLNNKNVTRGIHCELIVETVPSLQLIIRTLFGYQFNALCYIKYIALVSSISWGYTTSTEIYSYDYRLTSQSILHMFSDFRPVSQYIDETGKMRRINFAFRDNVCPINIFEDQEIRMPTMMFTICVSGFQPENLPYDSDVYLADSEFILALMSDSPVGRTVDDKHFTTGLWFSSDSVKFAFYFPVIPIDKYSQLPIGPEQYYAVNNNSSIHTLISLQRKANIFANILKYLFTLYRRSIENVAAYIEGEKESIMFSEEFKRRGGKEVPKEHRNVKLRINRGERAGLQVTDESIITEFANRYFNVVNINLNSNKYYDFSRVPRKFPEVRTVDEALHIYEQYAPTAFRNNKIIILNSRLREIFLNLLSDFYHQNSDDAELPVYLDKYYFAESDYIKTSNNIVFVNELLYSRWYKSVTAGIQYAKRIHNTIQYFSSFETYIYAMKLPNGGERHYIIQRVNNDSDYTALTVALIWQRARINVGHIIPKEYNNLSYSTQLPNFLIWGIDINMHIVPHIDGRTDRTEKCVEILYFGKFINGSEKRYAAMLPLD